MKCWIKYIPQEKATGRLADVYDNVKTSHGNVDHVYLAQSLMPETIVGHDILYKAVLHNHTLCLPKWFLELPEVNQVCACFNYTNRLLNGLGVDLGDERIGFYGQ